MVFRWNKNGQTQYKALTKRIEDILTGQRSFITLGKEIEKYARNAVNIRFKKQAKKIDPPVKSEYQRVMSLPRYSLFRARIVADVLPSKH